MWEYNPLTPKISLVILLTVSHTVLVMIVLENLVLDQFNSQTDIFFLFSSLVCLIFVLIMYGEILSWSLMEFKGLT